MSSPNEMKRDQRLDAWRNSPARAPGDSARRERSMHDAHKPEFTSYAPATTHSHFNPCQSAQSAVPPSAHQLARHPSPQASSPKPLHPPHPRFLQKNKGRTSYASATAIAPTPIHATSCQFKSADSCPRPCTNSAFRSCSTPSKSASRLRNLRLHPLHRFSPATHQQRRAHRRTSIPHSEFRMGFARRGEHSTPAPCLPFPCRFTSYAPATAPIFPQPVACARGVPCRV